MRSLLVCARAVGTARRLVEYTVRLGLHGAARIALSASEALALVSQVPFEVVLVETAAVRPDCVGFARRLLDHSPGAVIVFLGENAAQPAAAVMTARGGIVVGADLNRQRATGLLAAVVAAVVVATPPATTARTDLPSGPDRLLTDRELQVVRGMSEGRSNAEIARDLFLSKDTVKTHARRLFRKLGARDRAQAVAAVFRAGLLS